MTNAANTGFPYQPYYHSCKVNKDKIFNLLFRKKKLNEESKNGLYQCFVGERYLVLWCGKFCGITISFVVLTLHKIPKLSIFLLKIKIIKIRFARGFDRLLTCDIPKL